MCADVLTAGDDVMCNTDRLDHVLSVYHCVNVDVHSVYCTVKINDLLCGLFSC